MSPPRYWRPGKYNSFELTTAGRRRAPHWTLVIDESCVGPESGITDVWFFEAEWDQMPGIRYRSKRSWDTAEEAQEMAFAFARDRTSVSVDRIAG